jgi:hypothetical protein
VDTTQAGEEQASPTAVPSVGETPVAVLVADVEDGPPNLDVRRSHYRAAWVLLRRDHRPHALVEVDLHDGGAAAAEFGQRFDGLRSAPPDPAADGQPIEQPAISVVIPTIVGRVDELARCLDALAASDYDRFEVVLVDNRRQVPDSDPLPDLVAERTGVRVVREPRPGISAARNAGVAAANSEVIAFTDDDVRVDPGWLRAIGTRFAHHPEEQIVTGLVLPSELDTPAQLMFERYYGGFSSERTFEPMSYGVSEAGSTPWDRAVVIARDARGREVRSFAIYGAGACGAGCNMAFRRTALPGDQPFDVALGTGTAAQGGEDLAAMIRVLWTGGRIGYEPAALVHHQHRREYSELVRQMRGYGAGFTAMLTSLVMHDPRHLLGLATQIPKATTRLATAATTRLRGRRPERADLATHDGARKPALAFPPELARRELIGYTQGVGAYLRSRRTARAWTP